MTLVNIFLSRRVGFENALPRLCITYYHTILTIMLYFCPTIVHSLFSCNYASNYPTVTLGLQISSTLKRGQCHQDRFVFHRLSVDYMFIQKGNRTNDKEAQALFSHCSIA